ncbi:MAG: hypothetical protein D3923_15295, partial [Candidatus Electrothrix sp. AR3]|nr:hypothetical protein [Candidatus Electrothrix sp. AR3]
MLIIVHDAWNSSVQTLKAHEDALGISTTIVNVSAIPGGNSHTAIKEYIQDIYDDPSRDLAFVLLVGDLEDVDSFTVSGGESDPTYSKLAGSDDYPDIIVGRLSAESAADVDTQVERIIEYETMSTQEQSWFWDGIGIASQDGTGDGDDSEYDWEHLRNIRTDLLGYGYMQIDELYEGSQGSADSAGNPTDTMVSNSVNAGRGIINYTGHGSLTSWTTSGFNISDVNALTNDNMLPFIFSVACENGNFGEQTCFAESWMRATNGTEPTGAIGIYASSIDQPWDPPMEAQDEFNALYVADSYKSFGAYCYAAASSMMDDYPGVGVETFDTWHIFGDPTLRITVQNTPPIANAGPDQSGLEGDSVRFDGSGSSDADNDPLSYLWTLTAWPVGSLASLDNPTVDKPCMTADLPGRYEVSLVVNDGTVDSTPDSAEAVASDAIKEICPCEGIDKSWQDHGKYVSCITTTAEKYVELGLISETEKDAIVSAAGKSACGR